MIEDLEDLKLEDMKALGLRIVVRRRGVTVATRREASQYNEEVRP